MSEELKIAQMRAAQMLVFGWDIKTIASKLNVCVDTIYRWKKLPEFKEYLNKALTDKTHLRVAQLLDDSFTALSESLCRDTSDAVRLRAALSVLKIFNMERIESPWMDGDKNYREVKVQLDIPEEPPLDETNGEQSHAP